VVGLAVAVAAKVAAAYPLLKVNLNYTLQI
jgi:hypothetical protein